MRRLRRHTNWWLNLILLVLIAAGITGAVFLVRGKASASSSSNRTTTVAIGNVTSTVSASGTIGPATSMDLNFQTSGIVTEVDVKVGDTVQAGQVVGRLDPTDADAKVSSAQASLVTAQNTLASDETTYTTDVADYADTSTQVVTAYRALKEAKANLASAEAGLASAVKDRSYYDLTSPIAGTITAVNGVVGTSGSGGSSSSSSSTTDTAFAVVSTNNQMVVTASFSEVDVAKVQIGQTATITFPAVPSATATGKVTNVADTSTVTSNVVSYPVTIAVGQLPAGVRSGMSADVDVVVGSRSGVLVVPNQAITTSGRVSTVRKMVNGQEQIAPVQVGLKGNSTSEVTSGVQAGDVLVLQIATTTNTNTGTPAGGFRGGAGGGTLGRGLGG